MGTAVTWQVMWSCLGAEQEAQPVGRAVSGSMAARRMTYSNDNSWQLLFC